LRIVDQSDAAFFQVATALSRDVVERRAETGDERHGRRIGAFALDGVLALLAEVEVVARILGLLHGSPSALAHAEIGKARRNHDSLLRSAYEHVDAPGVDVEVGGAEAGNAVDDEDGVRSANDLGDGLNIVAHGRGGFRGLGVDHLVLRLERFFHFGEVEGLPVGGGEHVDFAAEGLGQSGPALAEFTGSEHQDAVAGEVRLETEASMAPVPEQERRRTSFLVPTKTLSWASTFWKRARNSGVR